MKSCLAKLCIFLFLTVEGTLGSELTINVRKNASVTIVCSIIEDLRKCLCPSYPQNCNTCPGFTTVFSPFTFYGLDNYFKLSGLKLSNSGLYACYSSGHVLGKKYRLNVFEDHDPTVVIGTVGRSIVISCDTELDITAASEKHWCRLSNANLCQPDMVMGPENETRGDFKILYSHSSVCLEKRHLTLNDTGFYRFTQIFQNRTKVYVVELQVKDKPNFLQISPVLVKAKPDEYFQITCQYSQELQEFSKSWLCDFSECPETVRSKDDRFQSALVLTIDHVACSNIRYFQCVAKMSASSVKSDVYQKPLNLNPIVDVVLASDLNRRKVKVKTYSLLNLICPKSGTYFWDPYIMNRGRWGSRDNYYYQDPPYWCRVSHSQCLNVKENVKETTSSFILQICVTPKDNGTTYRCLSSKWNPEVEIIVIAPTPPQPVTPAVRPKTPQNFVPGSYSGKEHNVGIIIVVTSIIFLIIIMSVTFARYKGQKLREWFFARRSPLSAVDIHANMYADAVAHYYRHGQRQLPPPEKQVEGDDTRTSSSSDDEFEELPVRPKRSSSTMQEETDYVRVKPGEAAHSQNVQTLLRDSEQFGKGGLPLHSYENVSGWGRKGEVAYRSKTNTGKVVKKLCQDTAQSSSGCSNIQEDGDEDEVTYTHVIIKPKHQLK